MPWPPQTSSKPSSMASSSRSSSTIDSWPSVCTPLNSEELSMRNGATLVLAGSLGAVGLALVSCDDKKDDRPVADKVENAVEKGGEKVGKAVEKTGEAIQRGAEKAAPAIGDAADKAVESAKHAGARLRDAIDATPVE